MNKRVLIIYHFFHPDGVVSSRQMSGLAKGLVERGWDVSALTSNRVHWNPKIHLKKADDSWHGVKIHRCWRPAFKQSSNLGRLLNALFLSIHWLFFIARRPAYDAIILGTDPQFGYFMLPFIRLAKPRSKLFHWAFDLYPEAIIANETGILSKLARAIKPLTGFCYRRLDAMVDIGPCMRKLLDRYGHGAKQATLVPWALAEPAAPLKPDPITRSELFGDAKLALLYSGTIGKAHEFKPFIALARELRHRSADIAFCFAGRGNCYDEMLSMVSYEDSNISFAGFADEAHLERRLGAGDIHMISLRAEWEGIVVPSKFFGSLAAGKPVLYAGTPNSSIKTWIDQYQVGLAIDKDNLSSTADALCHLAENPSLLREKQNNAFKCYSDKFSKADIIDGWDHFLREVLVIKK